MTTPVAFDDIRLSYGNVTALDGLSTTFDPGFNVVLGPNGSGKTMAIVPVETPASTAAASNSVQSCVTPPDENTNRAENE